MILKYVKLQFQPTLSILICTLDERKEQFEKLCEHLMKISHSLPVEIIALGDNREKTVGTKRNILLEASKGEYIAFIDDDDGVSPCYCTEILKAVQTHPDCVGIEGLISSPGVKPAKFIHSVHYKTWSESNGVYYRSPNHLNPVKRQLANETRFPEKNFGEDQEYSIQLRPKLKTEVYIPIQLYYYDYDPEKTATKGR